MGQAPTTLVGTASGRILDTVPETTIRLTRLTFRGGPAGGIQVTEGASATLSHSRVVGNSTVTRAGAGILNGGELTINSSRILRNHSALDGGGIFNFGNLEVNDSAINRNQASDGGGLFAEGAAELNGSTVRFNTGGGILDVAGITLNDTVVSDNTPYDCSCGSASHAGSTPAPRTSPRGAVCRALRRIPGVDILRVRSTFHSW